MRAIVVVGLMVLAGCVAPAECVPATYESDVYADDPSYRIPVCPGMIEAGYGCEGDDFDGDGDNDLADIQAFCSETFDGASTTRDLDSPGGEWCYLCD